jgi:cyclic pyranopterin phosphate synthase
LSLAAWQTLEVSRRLGLIELGTSERVATEQVVALLGQTAERRDGIEESVSDQPSPLLREQVPEWTDRLTSSWSKLSALQRYALEKMASSRRREPDERVRRLREACEEICAEPELSHVDGRGQARMVDVSAKAPSLRQASASARLRMQPSTLDLLRQGRVEKGDVMATARIAGIQAAKRTWELIPLCHSIALSAVQLELSLDDALPGVRIVARARTLERTGVEMEALVAASVAGLTLYDMLKSIDRAMVLEAVQLEEKSGGRSGSWQRNEP